MPKFEPTEGKWTNLSILYMKEVKDGKLEFDMDLQMVSPLQSNIDFFAEKPLEETTYREQPFYYHAIVARVDLIFIRCSEQ